MDMVVLARNPTVNRKCRDRGIEVNSKPAWLEEGSRGPGGA